MKTTTVAVALLAFAGIARAEVKTKAFDYKAGDTVLQGFIAWDDALKDKRPGVLVVHEWWGHNEHARHSAEKLAKAGYVGLALDMFGKGKIATHAQDAQAFVAEATKDPKVTDARFNAALEILKKDPHVDKANIAAIGYCFGGGVALNQAREGADLKAVATFHGSLTPIKPAEKGKFKPRVLVMTGGADPMITNVSVDAFKKEMDAAGVNYRVIVYPGAKHAFTNPNADKAGVEGLAYNADADQKSWAELLKFLTDVFGK